MTAAMQDNQVQTDDGINPEKTSRAYMLLAIMLFTAITGAGFLQHHIGNKQSALMQVAMPWIMPWLLSAWLYHTAAAPPAGDQR